MALFSNLLSAFVFFCIPTAHAMTNNSQVQINEFKVIMHKKYQFSQKQLDNDFSHFTYNPKVIENITHPFEKKPYDFYRQHFVSKNRIDGGIHYWQTHQPAFHRVTKKFGVNPSIILAILGVETAYGTQIGHYNEFDALATLSFYYPPRAKFFKKELREYLLLCRKQNMNALNQSGSYAGALGIPQFMPSSYQYYGVDYTGNHHIDLLRNHGDAIASVANYLAKHGWQYNQVAAIPVTVKSNIPKQFIQTRLPTLQSLQSLKPYIRYQYTGRLPQKAAIIAMQNTDGTSYWLVFQNFKAILSYNPSDNYALAVYELSKAIQQHARQTS